MEFQIIEPNIEITGKASEAARAGLRLFPSIVAKYLVRFGIAERDDNGEPVFDNDAWHSQEAWLAAYKAIADEIEPGATYNIGVMVPKYAELPPTICDIYSGLESLDIAYHMNHRKNGVPMFDPVSGTMQEGIGHYGYKRESDRRIVCVCDTPLSCEFDHGIIMGMASRFVPNCKVTHADGPCRRNAPDRSCTYVVTW